MLYIFLFLNSALNFYYFTTTFWAIGGDDKEKVSQ